MMMMMMGANYYGDQPYLVFQVILVQTKRTQNMFSKLNLGLSSRSIGVKCVFVQFLLAHGSVLEAHSFCWKQRKEEIESTVQYYSEIVVVVDFLKRFEEEKQKIETFKMIALRAFILTISKLLSNVILQFLTVQLGHVIEFGFKQHKNQIQF